MMSRPCWWWNSTGDLEVNVVIFSNSMKMSFASQQLLHRKWSNKFFTMQWHKAQGLLVQKEILFDVDPMVIFIMSKI